MHASTTRRRCSLLRRLALAAALLGVTVSMPSTAAGVAQFSRTMVNFARIGQDIASSVQPVFVTNIGDRPLAITGLVLEGPDAATFRIGGTCSAPGSLAPQDRCHIDIVASPTGSPRSIAATLTVQTDATPSDAPIALFAIVDFLSGTILQPRPDWLDFGPQPLGDTSSPLALAITNEAGIVLTLVQNRLQGGDASDFSFSSVATGRQFSNGSTCTATIAFTPQAAGPRSTELVFQTNFGSLPSILSVLGEGLACRRRRSRSRGDVRGLNRLTPG